MKEVIVGSFVHVKIIEYESKTGVKRNNKSGQAALNDISKLQINVSQS